MFKQLFLCAALLCCGNCNADEYGYTVTIDPGEAVLVKTSDGKSSIFIDYRNKSTCQSKGLGIESPQAYCVEYHITVWVVCPACCCYYDAYHHTACTNACCSSKMQ